jgi:hypothetical protein
VSHRIDPRRYPAVYLLRARREREEAEIREPVLAALDLCQRRLRAAQNALASLEGALGSRIAERMVERIASSFANRVRRYMRRALLKAIRAHARRPSIITLKLLPRELVWLDPESLERRAVEELAYRMARSLRARCKLDGPVVDGGVTVLRVEVPAVGYEQHIMPEHIGIREQYIDRGAA